MSNGEGRWQSVGDPVPEGWEVGVVDKKGNVWVAPRGWTPAPYVPDLTQPWPGRPAGEVPRVGYRGDGTFKSAGYTPAGAWQDVTPPWVLVPMKWVQTLAELEAHIAPIRAALGG